MRPQSLPWTDDPAANELLARDGLALILGMLYDQQFPMERAFFGPYLLSQRLGESLDCERLAGYDPDKLADIFRGPPAIHRYPGSMAQRTQDLCRTIMEDYEGKADNIWETAASGGELRRRLEALPGFGKAKARIFVGVIGKRIGLGPPGWELEAADWPSIADVANWEDIFTLREQKRAMKAQK